MPSLTARIANAARALFGREERDYGFLPPSLQSVFLRQYGMPPPFKPEQAQQAYSDNAFIYAAINVIAQEVARTKFKLVKKDADGDIQEVEHQAVETLRRPQPTAGGKTILTGYQLKFLLTQYLYLNGEGFWLLDGRNQGGAPTIATPLNPAYVYEQLNDDGSLKSYTYRFVGGGGQTYTLDPADVVHFKSTDPKNWYRGHSPMQPIRYAADSYKEADILNTNRLKNNAMPAGFLETDQKMPDTERLKLLQQFKQMYGGADNAGKVAALPWGMKFSPAQQTNHDMQFIEGKKLTRDEILANLRVPLEMLGKTESKTRSNADASIYVFARFTVLPVLEMIADTLTNDYLVAFPNTDGLEFIFDDPVPENEENKRSNAMTLFQTGAITPDEIRQDFAMEPLELPGTQTPYTTIQSIPMNAPDPKAESQNQPTNGK